MVQVTCGLFSVFLFSFHFPLRYTKVIHGRAPLLAHRPPTQDLGDTAMTTPTTPAEASLQRAYRAVSELFPKAKTKANSQANSQANTPIIHTMSSKLLADYATKARVWNDDDVAHLNPDSIEALIPAAQKYIKFWNLQTKRNTVPKGA